MSDNTPDLAALLCSRLCHDLLSPVGAMNNGIELLSDETDPAMRERCIELLAESARSAANKLKFFRLAFGAAGGFGDDIDLSEAKNVIEALVTSSGRTELVWGVNEPAMPKHGVKILLNLVAIANDALIRGGTLSVAAEKRSGRGEIVVRAEGARLVMDQAIRAVLAGETAASDIDSRSAAAWMVSDLAQRHAGQIMLAQEDGALTVGAVFSI